MADKHLGVYIHIPFCASKCGYCDFYSLAGRDDRMDAYKRALNRHIREAEETMAPYYIDSVYIGGGTPSFFGAVRLADVLNELKQAGRVLKTAEVTVECNPDSVTATGLRILRREGVNRISLGMQAADDSLLKLIGRRHNFRQVKDAVKTARAVGFDNISLDLIYGLPGQTRDDWANTLAAALNLAPEHLSCYGLTLEEGTPMYRRYHGTDLLPSDDEQADMYLYTVDTLQRYGYLQYEVSNFSLMGRQSRHNMKYWDRDDYLGFGPGAHSCIGGVRYSYVRSLEQYIAGVNGSGEILDEYEEIGEIDRAAEYIMLGMRRSIGISGEEYARQYRGDFAPLEPFFNQFEKRGWAVQDGGRWHFTPQGFLLSNQLIGILLEAQSRKRLGDTPWMADQTEGKA